jgi:hypothetical protein
VSGRAVAVFALAGLVAGVAVAMVVTAATDEVYRATALLRAVPAAPGEAGSDTAGERTAATFAQIADSRGFLAERELPGGRVDARHLDGSDVVEIVARGETLAAARTLADAVATALVADVEQTARQRSARVEAELRPRVEQLSAAIAELESTTGSLPSAATTDRLRALRAERAAFQARIADAAVRGARERVGLVVAAPASADDDPVRPRRVLNIFGGVLLGLVAGLGSSLLYRRRPEPADSAEVLEPAVRLLSPKPGEELTGQVVLEAAAPGAASLELLVSDGSPDWRTIAEAEGESATIEWDASGLEPGAYWLCVLAREGPGETTPSEPVPVTVARPDSSAQYAAAR